MKEGTHMETKGILHLNYEDKSRTLNYVQKPNGKIVVITSGKSHKVAYMKNNHDVELVFGEEVIKAEPTIIEDPKVVQANFNFMTEHNNNHFKAYHDMFVTVEFSL